MKAKQQILTCLGFPSMDTTCLKHYTAEGVCMTLGQAATVREEGHGKDEMKGDKMGGKFKMKGKQAAPDRSLATNRNPGSYQGKFWTLGGNNDPG